MPVVDYEYVKNLFLKNGFYLESDYISAKEDIVLSDKEGYLYQMSYGAFYTTIVKRKGKPDRFSERNIYTYQNIDLFFSLNYPDIYLYSDYDPDKYDSQRRMTFKDTNGYLYFLPFSYIKADIASGLVPNIVDTANPHSLENISLWIRINEKAFDLCDDNVYVSNEEKLKFYCHICEEYFYTKWGHISQGIGCPFCSGRKTSKKRSLGYLYPKLSTELSEKNDFSAYDVMPSSHKYAKWICSVCNYEWEARINSRTNNNCGCPACSGRVATDKNRLSILYPEISLEWHPFKNGKLTPYDVAYGSGKVVWWLCKSCGNEWSCQVYTRTGSLMCGCPKCSSSKGEKIIRKYLDENNIFYVTQARFRGCVNERELPFDFYLPDYNCCIEYHGEQHYRVLRNDIFGGEKEFKDRQKRDKIKEKYCIENNITLLVIPYWNINEIDEILSDHFTS